MIIGATKKLSKDVKDRYSTALMKGDLEQVKLYTSQLVLDPKDRDNLAIRGIVWSFNEMTTKENLEVVNYFLSLPQTRKWFGERTRPIKIASGIIYDFYSNEKEEREQMFHEICKKIWKKLTKLRLTDSPLASDIINHLLQIAQDNHFETPPEFNFYRRMSLSSIWNAFTALPARVSSFLFSPSQSSSTDTQELDSPKSPALNECDSDVELSDNDSGEEYQPDLDSSDTDCDSESNNALDSETESDCFDLIAYQNWKQSEEVKESAKRFHSEKPSSSSDVDSDDARPKRQRKN